MAFDWKSFSANFMTELGEGIDKRAEIAADEKELLDEEYKEAKTVFKNRKNAVADGMSLVGKAKMLGANDQQIKAAVSSGKTGLVNFVKGLSSYSVKKGGGTLSFSEVDTLVEGEELFEAGDVEEFMQRSYGLFQEDEDKVDYTDKRNTFQQMFSIDPKGSARASFGSDRMNMIELARQDAYDSLAPDRSSVFLTLEQADVNVYDPIKTNQNFIREFEAAEKLIKETKLYKTSLGEGEQENIVRDAQLQVMERYIALYGESFIAGLPRGVVPKDLVTIAEAGSADDPKKTQIAAALSKAAAADLGNMTSEVKGNKTVKYNVDANGILIGPVTLTNKNGETVEIDQSRLPELKEMGFELNNISMLEPTRFDIESAGGEDILSGRGLEILDAEVKTTPEKTYYLVDGKAVDGVPPRPELGIGNVLRGAGMDGESRDKILAGEMAIPKTLRPGQWDELFGDTHDPETGARLVAPKGAVGLGSPTRKGQDQEPNFEGPLSSALPQSGFTSAADSSSPDFEYVDDEGNIAEITVEELPPAPEPEPAPLNVVSTQEFGRQSFSVTPDGKVYINDRKTGRPKAEVTDSVIKESVLDQNKQFIRGAVNTFFNDANEKGYMNDKARLLEAWKRFAGKNRLSSYVTQKVLKSIEEG